MAIKGSLSTPPGVILMLNKYKEYIHLTQVAKSSSISFVAQIGNAFACLSHSFGPWILDFEASDNLYGNKDFFLPLLLHHLYP